MNHFMMQDIGIRYAKNRPYFHPLVFERVQAQIALTAPQDIRGLDVACGTGQSTKALAPLSENIVAMETAYSMLSAAPRDAASYVQAGADQFPFVDNAFHLLSVALAFHCFDRQKFLTEAARVLKPSGWLLIYNNVFLGRMKEHVGFIDWVESVYLNQYPTPARNRSPFTVAEAQTFGFRWYHEDRFCNEVRFTASELVAYLITQTNILQALASDEIEKDIRTWLRAEVDQYFTEPSGQFVFEAHMGLLQR